MFSWGNSGKGRRSSQSSSYPGTRVDSTPPVAQTIQGSIRPPAFTRQQHLDSYLNDATLKASTRRVSNDDSTYDTVFQTTAGDALILRVSLPDVPSNVYPTSPLRAPFMTLVGLSARHSWVDSRMKVVGYPPIQNDDAWRNSKMLLAEAVNAVVRQFQLQPPQILQITDKGLQLIQQTLNKKLTAASGTANSNSNGASTKRELPPDYDSLHVPEIDLPDIPRTFPELDGMDRDELQNLLDDELDFVALRNNIPVFQQITEKSAQVFRDNFVLANANLSKEETLKQLHNKVTCLRETLDKKVQAFQQLEAQQDELCAPPDTNIIIRQLQKATKESLDQSEEMAAEWIEDGGNIDDFVKEFIAIRTVHHARAAKVERLQTTTHGATNDRY